MAIRKKENPATIQENQNLVELMGAFANGFCTFSVFKERAFLFADFGADLTVKDNDRVDDWHLLNGMQKGNTLLHHLILNLPLYYPDALKEHEIANLLRKNTHLVNIKNDLGFTPWELLIRLWSQWKISDSTFISIAKLLIRHGADLTTINSQQSRNTLLHDLVQRNQSGNFNELIAHMYAKNKYLIKIKNALGLTPLQLAESINSPLLHQLIGFNRIPYALVAELLMANEDLVHKKNWLSQSLLQVLSNRWPQDKTLTTKEFIKTAKLLIKLSTDLLAIYPVVIELLNKLILTAKDDLEDGVIIEIAEEIFKLFGNLNFKNSLGETFLHSAIRSERLELAAYLVKKGLNNPLQALMDLKVESKISIEKYIATAKSLIKLCPDLLANDPAANELLNTLILTDTNAIEDEEIIEIAEEIFKLSGNLNFKNSQDETFLHSASSSGRLELAKYLVKKGLDITAKTSDGCTMLHCARLHENEDFWNWLHDDCQVDLNATNENGDPALFFSHNNLIMLEWFCEKGADLDALDADGDTLLHSMVGRNNYQEQMAILLEKNPQLISIENTNEETVLQTLMNRSYNDEDYQIDDEEYIETVRLLMNRGADLTVLNCNGDTLLHHLIINNVDNNFDEIIAEILNKNKDVVNIKNAQGNTPLQVLMDLKVENKIGSGSLISTAKILVSHDADLSVRRKDGNKLLHEILHIASHLQNVEFWQWLHGHININAPDANGQTSLHLAVLDNNLAMVKWLVEKGANFDLQDKNGKTALNLSENPSHKLVSNFLLKCSQKNKTIEDLLAAIQDMHDYGVILMKEKSFAKGTIAMHLAIKLKQKINFVKNNKTELDMKKFCNEFLLLLNSRNKEMSEYRIEWHTICKNIAIALTGFGALVIAGKLVHSKITTGRMLFFFQDKETTCEKKLEAVRKLVPALAGFTAA